MAWTITPLSSSSFAIKFLVRGDGVAANAIIDNATLVAALPAAPSPFKNLFATAFASADALRAATTDTPSYDVIVEPRSEGGTNVTAWSVAISTNKTGYPELIVAQDDGNLEGAYAYVILRFNHSICR